MISLRILSVAVSLFATYAAVAQPPPPLEAYGAMPTIDMMVISPSGNRIAYRMTTSEQDAIVIVDLGKRMLVGGMQVGDIAVRELRFVDDENLIIVAGRTSRAYGFRGQFDYSAAFRLEVATQSLDQLLAGAKDLYPAQSGLGEIVAVADKGRRLLMPAYHIEEGRPGSPRYGLYTVDFKSNRARIADKGAHATIDWFANRGGDIVARVDFVKADSLYRIWSLSSSNKLIFETETDIPPVGPVGLVPQGDALVYAATGSGSDFLTLFRMSLADGSLAGPIANRDDSSIEVVHSDINRVVYGVQYSGFAPSYEFFDAAVNARVEKIVSRLDGTSASIVSWSDDFEDILVRVSGGLNSGAYMLFRKGSEEPQLVGTMRPEITAEQVVPTIVTSYLARDGLEIPALVTALPDLRANGNAPLVVLPHGGPAAYDRLEFDWLAQYFAGRGYVVLQPQFRGSSGFGLDFMRAGYGEWGGKMQTDLDDGVDQLVKDGLVDPDRVCIVGASYGGYAALAAGAFSPDKYSCVASIAGISDLERMLRSDRRKYGRRHWAINYWERQYGGSEFDWDALRAISPVNFPEDFKAPVLLIHGRDDTVVPIDQSKVMHKALRRAGKDVSLVELKGEDHWLSYSDSRLAMLGVLAKFVEKHLGAG